MNTSTHQHINASTHQHSHQQINKSTHQHINTSAHQHINTSTHQHINSSAHQYINVPARYCPSRRVTTQTYILFVFVCSDFYSRQSNYGLKRKQKITSPQQTKFRGPDLELDDSKDKSAESPLRYVPRLSKNR